MKKLNLAQNQISKIKNISAITSLEFIDLTDNKISGPLDFTEHFSKLNKLKSLNLSNN